MNMPADDFRDHTCGECAWERFEQCRRVMWGTIPQYALGINNTWVEPGYFGSVCSGTPACPAFVPKEKPKSSIYGPGKVPDHVGMMEFSQWLAHCKEQAPQETPDEQP